MSSSSRSIASESAGKQSVIRFIQSRCTGSSIVKPKSVAVKMLSTSLALEASRN